MLSDDIRTIFSASSVQPPVGSDFANSRVAFCLRSGGSASIAGTGSGREHLPGCVCARAAPAPHQAGRPERKGHPKFTILVSSSVGVENIQRPTQFERRQRKQRGNLKKIFGFCVVSKGGCRFSSRRVWLLVFDLFADQTTRLTGPRFLS